MRHRKIRTYPPVIVTLLVALAFSTAAASAIIGEAERQDTGQRGELFAAQTAPVVTVAQPTPETQPTPQPTPQATPEAGKDGDELAGDKPTASGRKLPWGRDKAIGA